jgi:hypothetical protein
MVTPRRKRSLDLYTADQQSTYAVVNHGTKDVVFETTNAEYALQAIRKS